MPQRGLRAWRWIPAALLAGLAIAAQAGVPGEDAALRDAFATAYAQAQAGAAAPAAGDPASLVAYPLYPYLQAARLRASLERASTGTGPLPVDAEVAAFLAAHGDEPVSRQLRRPWLDSLAARGQWQAFLDAYAGARSPDQALRCTALRARIALGQTADLAGPATAEWLGSTGGDDACAAAFDWLRGQGLLDDALVAERTRRALAAGQTGLARQLARSLPEERARPLLQWADLVEDPRRALDALIASPQTPVEDAALLDGFSRLARRDPDAARERFDALLATRAPAAAQVSQLARALALGLAWNRDADALEYFARVAPADFDDASYAWRARAALWAGNWAAAAAAIAAMPPAMRDDPGWRYWAARAAAHDGDAAGAKSLYEAVASTDSWYGVLASARLGRRYAPHPTEVRVDAAAVDGLASQPGFRRARELLRLGWVPLAQSEWNAAYAALDPASRQAAIGLANRWGWYFQSIAAAAQLGVYDDYSLLYPTPFDAAVREGARLSGLSPTLIYAVIRQESLYQPWAVSGAGAVGLMQLLPRTARGVAAKMHRRKPSAERLTRPEVNVPLGAGHLAELLRRFDGQVLVALAAYNAGPNAVRRWLPNAPLDADVWVENIPYNETRAYVQRVMWHSVVFKWLEDRKPEGAKAWLAKVKPLD